MMGTRGMPGVWTVGAVSGETLIKSADRCRGREEDAGVENRKGNQA